MTQELVITMPPRPRCGCGEEAAYELDVTVSPLRHTAGRWMGDGLSAVASLSVPLCAPCSGKIIQVQRIDLKVAIPEASPGGKKT